MRNGDNMVTRNICPVCGNPDLSEPAYSEEEGWPSDEICSCCGYQFGYDDDSEGITHEQWRMRWIDEGMKWWSDTGRQPPAGWNPIEQLKNIGVFL